MGKDDQKSPTGLGERGVACPIADYGAIGDMHSVALVATDGSIDWCCLPRFDSSPVFHRLLDADDGGYFSIAPTDSFCARRSYVEQTNVLQTTFSTETGEVRLTDLMPVREDAKSGNTTAGSKILRRIEGVSGKVEVRVTIKPTFEWGRQAPRFDTHPWGVIVVAGEEALGISSVLSFEESEPGTLVAECEIGAGEEVWVNVEYLDDDLPPDDLPPNYDGLSTPSARHLLETTVTYWQQWLERCEYEGAHASLVERSALVLKLLTYAPTGAVIAAPTTSLPEELGGVRNWDYRYVWLRDAGLILRALQGLGYHDEAMAFWEWLEGLSLSDENRTQNVYRIDGSTDLPEQCLDDVAGYQHSQPVRIGNSAANQLQLDRFGHIIEAGYICQTEMREPHPNLKPVLSHLADQAAERWDEPDHGIWEMRSEPRQLVHSKLMCWVALDRALRLHKRGWLDGDVDRWHGARQELREAIEQRGYNKELGAFTQTLDGDALDASSLLIPLMGFLEPSDPRVHSTIDRIQDRLMVGGLVKRYRTQDGLPGREGTFVMCSFWLVSALAECGRHDEARDLFEEVTAHANDLGLLAEEVSGGAVDLLGNFPQGFSHLALIDAARRLKR